LSFVRERRIREVESLERGTVNRLAKRAREKSGFELTFQNLNWTAGNLIWNAVRLKSNPTRSSVLQNAGGAV
jgi:hypothetical protein